MGTRVGLGLGLRPGSQGNALRALILSLAPELFLPLTADANDASGHGRHGTQHNGVTYSSAGALFVAASSQYIHVPNWTSGYSAFSIFWWTIPTTLANNSRIVDQRGAGTFFDFYIRSDGGMGLFDGTNDRPFGMGSGMVAGVSKFMGVSVTGGVATPYLDGVAGTPVAWASNTSSDQLEIGRLNATSSNFYDGRVRNLGVTQQVLSAAQFAALAALGG